MLIPHFLYLQASLLLGEEAPKHRTSEETTKEQKGRVLGEQTLLREGSEAEGSGG